MTFIRTVSAGRNVAAFVLIVLLSRAEVYANTFLRGDVNFDGRVDLSDAVETLDFLFLGVDQPPICQDAVDANDDGAVDIADAIFTLSALFVGGPLWPPPLGGRGDDPTEDELDCAGFVQIQVSGAERISIFQLPQTVRINSQEAYDVFLDEYYYGVIEDRIARLARRNCERSPQLELGECRRRARETLFGASGPFHGLEGYVPPAIDFDRYTLLGQSTTASGCRREYTSSLTRLDSEEIVRFDVLIEEFGSCEPAIFRYVWILVEAIPPNYMVVSESRVVRP